MDSAERAGESTGGELWERMDGLVCFAKRRGGWRVMGADGRFGVFCET